MSDLFATATALTGIRKAFDNVGRTAARVAAGGDPGRLPEDLVALRESEFQVKANTAVLRTADEMIGTLLDRLA
jgi:hypothetical protein